MDKYTLPLTLFSAGPEDAGALYSWFSNVKEIRDWGGPHMDFPLSLERFKALVKFTEIHSFKLVDSENHVLAFGQLSVRLERYHFGRIAVSPEYRGCGLGREIMVRLIEQASMLKTGKGYSLFVMEDNHAAKQLYLSLGFKTRLYPEPLGPNWAACEYMIRDE